MRDTVLLTGARGLVGRALGPELRLAGYDVAEVGRTRRPEDANGTPLHLCDLADAGATRRLLLETQPAVIVHLAGGTAGDLRALYRDNVLSTVHLLESAAELASPPHCIVFGSAAEYGSQEGTIAPITESSPRRPLTDYGRAKLAQTALAEVVARAEGLPLTILRPFNVVAGEQPPGSPLGNLRRQLLAGSGGRRTLRGGRLDVVRDFIPLDAVVAATVAAVRTPIPGATVNLCSGVGIELAAIVRAMADRLGVEIEIEVDPALVAIPAAPVVVGDAGRMESLLGVRIRPTASSLAALLLDAGGLAPEP